MKTSKNFNHTILTITLVLISIFSFGATKLLADLSFNDEAYIDDIPFDTEIIYNQLIEMTTIFNLEEEAYIDDIPYNTELIAYEVELVQNSTEEYVDDIPFDTQEIAANYYYQVAISVEFNYPDESYISDIPFDTYCVANNSSEVSCELFCRK